MEGSASHGLGGVITSYSIHYTKLYEVLSSSHGVAGADQGPLLLALSKLRTSGAHSHRRITSYNVCYTKLLRGPGDSFEPMGADGGGGRFFSGRPGGP